MSGSDDFLEDLPLGPTDEPQEEVEDFASKLSAMQHEAEDDSGDEEAVEETDEEQEEPAAEEVEEDSQEPPETEELTQPEEGPPEEVTAPAGPVAEQQEEVPPAPENVPLFRRWDQFMTEIDRPIRDAMWEMGINDMQKLTSRTREDLLKPKGKLSSADQVDAVEAWLGQYGAKLAPVVVARPAARVASTGSGQDMLSPQDRHSREMQRRAQRSTR